MGLIHLVNEVGELRGAHTHTPECRLLYIYELHKKKSHHNYEGYFTVHIMCHTFNQFLHNLVNSSGLAMGELFPHWKTCCCAFLYRAYHACEIKEEKKKKVCNLRTDCIVAATSCWLCFHSNKNLHIGKSSRGECCSPFRKSCVLTGPDFNCAIHCTREETSSGDS